MAPQHDTGTRAGAEREAELPPDAVSKSSSFSWSKELAETQYERLSRDPSRRGGDGEHSEDQSRRSDPTQARKQMETTGSDFGYDAEEVSFPLQGFGARVQPVTSPRGPTPTPGGLLDGSPHDAARQTEQDRAVAGNASASGHASPLPQGPRSRTAKERWKRLRHTVTFANQMGATLKAGNDILMDESVATAIHASESNQTKKDANNAKPGPVFRKMGRSAMDGLKVKHDKAMVCFLADFYVGCLKTPPHIFLLGVLVAPVLLGFLFTPAFLLGLDGLSFEDGIIANSGDCTAMTFSQSCMWAAKRNFSIVLNVFLYALSLSTTFGGSPVSARSPYCLLVANCNTLMAQFLFVFLSGAVFARMSQPSQPVRCSRKAIIKEDDYVNTIANAGKPKGTHKVFVMRLVLVGPHPCELVDVKITVTFRIFIKLPSGSFFCSTHNLDLVRSEVAHLRYGFLVRHVIAPESPLFGHTRETMADSDASFSVSIVGMERTSMTSIFHMQEYFVHDNDVIWDGDFVDFVSLDEHGHKVMDHAKIDQIRTFKSVGVASQAISRMHADVEKRKQLWKLGGSFGDNSDDDNGDSALNSETAATQEDGKSGSSLQAWVGATLEGKSMSWARKQWAMRSLSFKWSCYSQEPDVLPMEEKKSE